MIEKQGQWGWDRMFPITFTSPMHFLCSPETPSSLIRPFPGRGGEGTTGSSALHASSDLKEGTVFQDLASSLNHPTLFHQEINSCAGLLSSRIFGLHKSKGKPKGARIKTDALWTLVRSRKQQWVVEGHFKGSTGCLEI